MTGPDTVTRNGFGDEILEAVRTWETARLAGVFPESIKPSLQDISREFTLAEEGDGWVLREVYSFKGAHARRSCGRKPSRWRRQRRA